MKFLKKVFVDSVRDMFKTVIKKRPGYTRMLLFLQLITYMLLWFNYGYEYMEYLYLLRVYPGFNASTYAYFNAIKSSIICLYIFFIVPRLTCHPSLYNVISLALQGKS